MSHDTDRVLDGRDRDAAGQLATRLALARDLLDGLGANASRGATARAVRFGHDVLAQARTLRVGEVNDGTRHLLDQILALSLRLASVEEARPPG
jgi:hypothetical protein